MIKISIPLELVETLISPKTSYYGSVMLLEIQESLENHLSLMLTRGSRISLQEAFRFVWAELVTSETDISSSYENDDL
jgi:hypothetical protein